MRFKNITEWIHFVYGQPIEKLNLFLKDHYNLYEYLEDETKYKIDSDLLLHCLRKFKDTKIEETFWSNTVCFIHNDSFSGEIFYYLIENKIALVTLCHLPLKDEFLWELVEVEEEAILTLGKRYYYEDKYSPNDLNMFLLRFNTCDWLWRSLIDKDTTNPQKKRLFRRMLFKNTQFNDYKLILIEMAIEKRLIKTQSIKLINKYYRTNNYRFLRGISQNSNTPIQLLKEMVNIKSVKYANMIRNYAKVNLNNRF